MGILKSSNDFIIKGIEMKESKEILRFFLAGCEAVAVSLENGKLDFKDVFNFWEPMTLAEDAFDDFTKAGAEMMNATPEEMEVMKKMAEEEFDIPQDDFEEIFELVVKSSLDLFIVVKKLRDKFKSSK